MPYKQSRMYFVLAGFLLSAIFAATSACQKTESPVSTTPAVQHQPGELVALLSDSLITVTTVKDGNIPVKGGLSLSAGTLKKTASGDWQARIVIDLKSWNSGLALRDQRVRDIFFDVGKSGFGEAVFTVDALPDAVVMAAQNGEVQQVAVDGVLNFVGRSEPLRVLLNIKEEAGQIAVTSGAPIPILISAWGLDANKLRLMQACAHREIADQVLVSFAAKFE